MGLRLSPAPDAALLGLQEIRDSAASPLKGVGIRPGSSLLLVIDTSGKLGAMHTYRARSVREDGLNMHYLLLYRYYKTMPAIFVRARENLSAKA